MNLNDLGSDLSNYQWKLFHPDTQADTFIEWCFEQKAPGLNQGKEILNEWRIRKRNYKRYIGMTVLDFQHYSRHDDTHSVSILNSIEMVLGRQRVIELAASDLWLLLEAAYCHDLGMSLSYEKLKGLWESEEFRTYLEMALASNDIDLKKASEYYHQMDNLLNQREQLKELDSEDAVEFSAEWPVEMQRNIIVLTASYIRSRHHTESKAFIKNLHKEKEEKDSSIEDRMTSCIAEISELHGLDFSDITKKLEYQELGFDVEYMHPRFAAAMLRLGDLLDLRNNRFNVCALSHFGTLPVLSEYHMKKHKAISHLIISPQKIEATAFSNEYEVCRVTGEWFQLLKKEVDNLICDWNRFSPEKLKGCILQRCKLKVFYGETEFDTKLQSSFEVDKKRLNLLMIGSNIYDSPLDCIREYIQNSIDASKMKLWLDIRNEKMMKDEDESLKDITPFSLEKSVYDKLAIELKVSVDIEKQVIKFQIIDSGIGMETECVNDISVVGRSWKQRKVYQDEVARMPDWLRPTGGFGIGLQSGFMLTDHVTITTKSKQEALGYEIELESPKKSGSIYKSRKPIYKSGTTVEFEIPIRDFYRLIEEIEEFSLDRHKELEMHFQYQYKDGFLKFENEDYACAFLRYYIKKIIPNPLFPIIISGDDKVVYEFRSPFTMNHEGFGRTDKGMLLNDACMCWVTEDLTVRLWDSEESTFVCVKTWPYIIPEFNRERAKSLNHFCYKNVKVGNLGENEKNFEYCNFTSMCIDIMGKKMEDVLSIRRNAFSQNFDIQAKYQKYLSLYVEAIYHYISSEKKKEKTWINTRINVFLYLLLAIQLLNREKLSDILGFFRSYILSPQYVLTKEIKNGSIRIQPVPVAEAFEQLCELFKKRKSLTGTVKEKKNLFVITDQKIKENQVDMISLETVMNDGYDILPEELGEVKRLAREIKDGVTIYDNSSICHALLKMGEKLPKCYFRLREDCTNNQGNLIYVMISGIEEDWDYKPQEILEEKEFLQNMLRIRDKRYVAENKDCGKYNELKVDRLPAQMVKKKNSERKETYLISPIGHGAYMNILLNMEIQTSAVEETPKNEKIVMNRFISKKKFLQLITEDKYKTEYEFLISWVYHYQLAASNNKLGKEDIDKKYRKMLEEAYDVNFKKK